MILLYKNLEKKVFIYKIFNRNEREYKQLVLLFLRGMVMSSKSAGKHMYIML